MYHELSAQFPVLPNYNSYSKPFDMPTLKRLQEVTARQSSGRQAAKTFQKHIISRFGSHLRTHQINDSREGAVNETAIPAPATATKTMNIHQPAKTIRKWAGGIGLTKTAIWNLMWTEGLRPTILFGTAGEVHRLSTVSHQRIFWVYQGSVTIHLPDENQHITLHQGDRLDLPPNIPHQVVVGSEGVLCFEAHLRQH